MYHCLTERTAGYAAGTGPLSNDKITIRKSACGKILTSVWYCCERIIYWNTATRSPFYSVTMQRHQYKDALRATFVHFRAAEGALRLAAGRAFGQARLPPNDSTCLSGATPTTRPYLPPLGRSALSACGYVFSFASLQGERKKRPPRAEQRQKQWNIRTTTAATAQPSPPAMA
jgi:hypothetical protein